MFRFFRLSMCSYTVTEKVSCLVWVISFKRNGGFAAGIAAAWHIGVATGTGMWQLRPGTCSVVWMWQILMLTVSTKQSIWRSLELIFTPRKLQNQAWGVSLGDQIQTEKSSLYRESNICLPQPLITPLSAHTDAPSDTELVPLCYIPYKPFIWAVFKPNWGEAWPWRQLSILQGHFFPSLLKLMKVFMNLSDLRWKSPYV